MKRSQVNENVLRAKKMLDSISFRLPRFAYWTMEEWKDNDIDVIKNTMLGWDITDFGMDKFEEIGAVLFTIRNGVDGQYGTPYAEKIIYLRDGQRLPCHYHVTKTEDIINRGGGRLWIKLFNAAEDGSVDEKTPVVFYSDGVKMEAKPGEKVYVETGNSITLTPYMYHIFGAEGELVVGEVSSINDDNTDNYFSEDVSRFAEIEEDEAPLVPLCNEYDNL
ncbi:MAG: D-lyxose/D-mannose family sugar isomerase [Clostridiales bacterium]|nr:D-lyxose/D-mannose family sugar isomerase [Clostridiales bacterium]